MRIELLIDSPFDELQMEFALISGTSIVRSKVFNDWPMDAMDTPFGPIELLREKNVTVINRHGFSQPLPPHRSNYRGYVSALKQLKIKATVLLSSVGSLRADLPPGALVSCSDYVSFAPMTFIDDRPSGFAPSIDNAYLPQLKARIPFEILTDKIYAQTRGPRFETKAEVRVLREWGCDVVGMTLANEADLLLESGISITSLCVIDNYAHGIGDKGLSMEIFNDSVQGNQDIIDAVLNGILETFHP